MLLLFFRRHLVVSAGMFMIYSEPAITVTWRLLADSTASVLFLQCIPIILRSKSVDAFPAISELCADW